MKIKGAILVGSALSLAVSSAMGSGFSVSYQSVSALGTAYAGSGVLSEDASNQWYNPATLAGLKKAQVTVTGHQVWIDTDFKADGVGGPGNFKDVEPFVGSAFLAVPINDTMTFGLGLTAPFGTKIEYQNGWGNAVAPGITSGDFYAQESDVKTVNINPSLGIQVTDKLNLGVGVSYQTIDADLQNAATRLEGDDDAVGWNVGLTYQADDNNRFGVAYRSKMEYTVDGDITFHPTPTNGLPASMKFDGKADIDLPASLQLSYAGNMTERTQLLLGVEWMEWSDLSTLDVKHSGPAPLPNPAVENFDWENTVRYSLGLRHTLTNDTVLRFGVAKEDSTQGTSNRSAASPDSDRVWVTLGAGFKPTDNMSIDVGYAHIFVSDADIARQDTINGKPPISGTYELDANVVGAQLNYTF
ncbi:OmpP1/FadL family transporter [Alloalcanivorax xenomutans]|uniref:OmpP1/FadL family transporter n=1 Tax=Alloalcanivorax xenomutans TaxID=1094342 RepID=UPI001F2B70CE|nr:outer membrane protein transport protein [Alloalcanivorax xenomutans]MCE7525518.1 outer membrane protein transport protein [Alloalcanivorax xenomutans]